MNAARPAPQSPDGAPVGPPASPPARRPTRRSWRDPRLAVGVLLVAGSVLAGSALLARADDTVTVWAAGEDLPAGATLQGARLEPAELRFGDALLAGRYLPADRLPADTVLLRGVAAGEIVPRSAVGAADQDDVAELPIGLPAEAVPAGLRQGQVVDVWVTPATGESSDRRAERVLEQVPVLAAPEGASALGPASSRQVVVGVPSEDEDVLARALGALTEGTAVLVRRG